MELSLPTAFQADRPSGECAGNKNRLLPIMDIASARHPAPFHLWIAQVLRGAFKCPGRGSIQVCRSFHAQSLMRTFLVEDAPPFIKAGLLFLAPQLLLHIQVHPFMRAVVLGTTGPAPLQIN